MTVILFVSNSNRVLRICDLVCLFSPNFKRDIAFKSFLNKDKFLASTKFEVRQNDPDNEFEGDIFAQTAPIPLWGALDQTLIHRH